MDYLDLTLPTLAENLALDEALLLEAEAGGAEVLRLWEWGEAAVVLGAAGKLADDVHEAACQADDVPILRRASGGGTVLLGPGCLLFSLILRFDRHPALAHIPSSYCWILQRTVQSLSADMNHLHCAGTSDLALGDHKISGNAQQRKRNHFLHHGTILYAFDSSLVGRYLRMPVRQPDYRGRREHAEFLTNLPISRGDLQARLRAAWDAEDVSATWPRDEVKALVAEKYSQAEWIRRR